MINSSEVLNTNASDKTKAAEISSSSASSNLTINYEEQEPIEEDYMDKKLEPTPEIILILEK